MYTIYKTPLGETGWLSHVYCLLAAQASNVLIHPPFPNTVVQEIFGTLPLTLQCLCDIRNVIPCHWSPSTSYPTFPKWAEDFPRGGKCLNDVPLWRLLSTSLIKTSGLIFIFVKIMNIFTCGEEISKLTVWRDKPVLVISN